MPLRQSSRCSGVLWRRTKKRRKRETRRRGWRKQPGCWLAGWHGVERKTRENKIHTRPLARLRFVHFIRANWIYLCGRLPVYGVGAGEVEMSPLERAAGKAVSLLFHPHHALLLSRIARFIVYLIPRCLSPSCFEASYCRSLVQIFQRGERR